MCIPNLIKIGAYSIRTKRGSADYGKCREVDPNPIDIDALIFNTIPTMTRLDILTNIFITIATQDTNSKEP